MGGYIISQKLIEEVRAGNDIVDVISEYVSLKKAGSNFKALCPFHVEKTPSFMVNPERQIFHCFGCGLGGNVFNFLMKIENLSFPEVVRLLAERAGIPLPQDRGSREEKSFKEELYKLNELAATYFHHLLIDSKEGEKARRYLKTRGIKEETARRFKLGYASSRGDGLQMVASQRDIPLSLLEKGGLVSPKKDGSGYYDLFRDRLVFPIYNLQGRVIGFGGRVFDDYLPKYLNSPETLIYSKGKNLYGLNFTKEAIRHQKKAIIVEGYFDLLTVYQAGLENVVATLGTSLTTEQAYLLRRYAEEALMVYDADTAGVAATLRGLDLLLERGFAVKIVSLSGSKDPDELIRKEGIGKFLSLLKGARELFEYRFEIASSGRDLSLAEEKVRIVKEIVPTLAKMREAIIQREYVRKLADRLSLAEELILAEIKKLYRGKGKEETRASMEELVETQVGVERDLIQLMLKDKEVLTQVQGKLEVSDFVDSNYRRIAQALFELKAQGEETTLSRLLDYLQDESLNRIISKLAVVKVDYGSQTKVLDYCIAKIKENSLRRERERLLEKIKKAQEKGEDGLLRNLLQEYQKLIR